MRDGSRFLTLIAIESDRLGARFGIRAAGVLGMLIALGYAIVLLFLPNAGEAAASVVARALFWLSWLCAGTAALSAVRELAALGADDGFAALLAQRGFAASVLPPARLVAAALRIARVIALPGVSLAILAGTLARSSSGFLAVLLLMAKVIGYSALLAATLAVLARWAALLHPRRARALLAMLIIVPELLRGVWSGVPSVPAFFGGLLAQLPARGASP
jgi:hypothetical protein